MSAPDPWSPEADAAEQAVPVAAEADAEDDDDIVPDAERVEPVDEAGYEAGRD
ncbi:MAG: hypothetical protein JO368_13270 [Acidimicrobiales bacterium]|nr:hypothetical protein [Acidimicrobiales bacterium]